GDDATLIVRADVGGNQSTGRIQFTREKGQWKILSELWDLGGDAEDVAPPDHQPQNDRERDAIRKLREKGFPDPREEFLVSSAVTGDLEAVKLFVQAGYSVNAKAQGSPAIVSAAMFNQPAVVLYLIEAGADVNARDDVNTTALMRIAEKCDATEVVKALLKAGARTDFKSAGGTTAEQLAGFSNCEENASAIRAAGKKKK
ncbi:MAG TPA: ankyrin repeat domain-containing protein, partial [Thermoanaerobaculia bacterium]|nr:ankyrin repeat domain-containing protein [Thermoanaerobaculia bacterium]